MPLIGSRETSNLPKIDVTWVRGKDNITHRKSKIHLILGKKDSGKSSLTEAIGLHYPKIIDFMGSRDNENLAFCRSSSPIDDILLVTGDNVDLDCSWDTAHVGDLTMEKIEDYEVTISANSFYSSQDSLFGGMEKIIENFWTRFSWKKVIGLLIREASSFIYSRMKQGQTIKDAKSDFIYFQRESRHFGLSPTVDTVRWTSLDKEQRDMADYLYIKRVGAQGLPRDIGWLYKYVDPMSLARLKPQYFLLLTDNASIGYGRFECPKFHKEEGVDLVKELNIDIDVGDEVEESTVQQVGDREHERIIRLYANDNSQENISKEVHRSSATVNHHIRMHNKDVTKSGACARCLRLDSEFAKEIIER